MDDCIVIGGGIIGLSLAVELHRRGLRVRVLDRRRARHTASWAAGGILPPPITRALHDPLEQIRDLSHRLYPDWCQRLAEDAGCDVPYERCGGVYLGRKPGEQVSLRVALEQWQQDGVRVETWSADRLRQAEPALAPLPVSAVIYHLPDEVLVRPPRLLKALREVLRKNHVPVEEDLPPLAWDEITDARVRLRTSHAAYDARHVCVAAGAWSPELLAPLGLNLPVEPRRGQMVRWQLSRPLFQRVINEGPRYLISRADGQLLAGSTVEDVGFQDSTTAEGVAELVQFAQGLTPQLASIEPAEQWAGLRPASLDGNPYLGRVPGQPRISVATGHFRSGIHLAPATARLMRQLICEETPDLDLSWFSLTR
jgi:glycine oxidase